MCLVRGWGRQHGGWNAAGGKHRHTALRNTDMATQRHLLTPFFSRHPAHTVSKELHFQALFHWLWLQKVTSIRNTRLESDSCQPSAIHPNSLLGIFTHHSQTSSQPSKWLLCTCTWHWATTAHGRCFSTCSLLLPGKWGWGGGPGEASYCWWGTLPYSGDFHTQRIYLPPFCVT